MTDKVMEHIRRQINALYPLENGVLNALMSSWETIEVKRKTVLTREGECEGYLYLVLEGV